MVCYPLNDYGGTSHGKLEVNSSLDNQSKAKFCQICNLWPYSYIMHVQVIIMLSG